MNVELIVLDCWNTLFYTDLPKHHFKLFFDEVGLDFGTYEHLKSFEEVFFLQKQLEYESAVQTFCKMNTIQSYDVDRLSEILYNGLTHNNFYKDTFEFLEKISHKSVKLCIISNTDLLSWRSLCKDYNLSQYFDLCLTSYSTGIMKPNPKIFQIACEICGVAKQNAVMIGDSYNDDYLGSKNAGIGKSYLIDRKGVEAEGYISLIDIYNNMSQNF